jgi:hypothetical protein
MPHAVGRSSSHNVATYFTAFAVSVPVSALGTYYVSFANEVRRRTSFSPITESTSLWAAMLSPQHSATPANGPSRADLHRDIYYYFLRRAQPFQRTAAQIFRYHGIAIRICPAQAL